MDKRLYLLVLLIAAVTAITLTSTYLFYRTALTASETFLSSHATALSATLEAALKRYGLRTRIFKGTARTPCALGTGFLTKSSSLKNSYES
ncbi:MAG: hypothetical protein HY755_07630 [Nitrospirae bacterium]|nr:hypothetical protein [Nitrospirota bacterium]